MEPESPSPYPQLPATCPYPEPTPSNPHDPLQFPEDRIIDINNIQLNTTQLMILFRRISYIFSFNDMFRL